MRLEVISFHGSLRSAQDLQLCRNRRHQAVSCRIQHLSINALRRHQIKNAVTLLMVSQGVPMILMGDEVARTQQGNNNAYCHDNDLNWFDWSLAEGAPGGVRLMLAGGLNADNVAEAIRRVRPWGVDVATGVESAPGRKDARKLRKFILAAREAGEEVAGEED